jgi:DNA-binding LacI/PurR family transcriptional regulator
VADVAGVSITTVSHALSGKGRLPEETRRRIQRVALELGYRASAVARGLASGRSGILALQVSGAGGVPLLSDFDYFSRLMNGATLRALASGYWLALAPPSVDGEAWARVHVDGAVVVDPVVGDPLVRMLRKQGIPFVTTGRSVGDDDGVWVDNNHAVGTETMLRHLERRGARRIALLTAPEFYSYTLDSRRAYEEWVRKRGRQPIVAVVSETLTEGAAYSIALELLARDPRPDAIYATLDRFALGALLAAQANRIPVPRELLVAGLTDSLTARRSNPPLTSLSLHPEEIGARAVEMVIALVEGRQPDERHRFIPTRVIPRKSTNRLEPSTRGTGAARTRNRHQPNV